MQMSSAVTNEYPASWAWYCSRKWEGSIERRNVGVIIKSTLFCERITSGAGQYCCMCHYRVYTSCICLIGSMTYSTCVGHHIWWPAVWRCDVCLIRQSGSYDNRRWQFLDSQRVLKRCERCSCCCYYQIFENSLRLCQYAKRNRP